MQWFKHDTDGRDSEGLAYLKAEMGWDWLARWYFLLEMVAAKMDKTDRCHLEYPISKWCKELECKPYKLRTFLVHIQYKLSCKVVENGNIIRIEIPNLLKKKDEYSRKSGQAPDNCPPQDKETDKDTDKEKSTPLPPKGDDPALLDLVKTYNTNKPPAWDRVNFEKLQAKPKRTLTSRLNECRKDPEFNLLRVIETANANTFLSEAKFVDLLWLCTRSNKHIGASGEYEYNWRLVLNGKFGSTSPPAVEPVKPQPPPDRVCDICLQTIPGRDWMRHEQECVASIPDPGVRACGKCFKLIKTADYDKHLLDVHNCREETEDERQRRERSNTLASLRGKE